MSDILTSDSQIEIKVLYFAKVKEILKKPMDIIHLKHNESKLKAEDIFNIIIEKNNQLASQLRLVFINTLISLNDEYVENDSEIKLKNGDEISVIPPISAG
jgi:molybdopterin converting factor small subunit